MHDLINHLLFVKHFALILVGIFTHISKVYLPNFAIWVVTSEVPFHFCSFTYLGCISSNLAVLGQHPCQVLG